MHWFYLLIAGIFEISWAIGLKFSHGFTQIIPSILTVACMILKQDNYTLNSHITNV